MKVIFRSFRFFSWKKSGVIHFKKMLRKCVLLSPTTGAINSIIIIRCNWNNVASRRYFSLELLRRKRELETLRAVNEPPRIPFRHPHPTKSIVRTGISFLLSSLDPVSAPLWAPFSPAVKRLWNQSTGKVKLKETSWCYRVVIAKEDSLIVRTSSMTVSFHSSITSHIHKYYIMQCFVTRKAGAEMIIRHFSGNTGSQFWRCNWNCHMNV